MKNSPFTNFTKGGIKMPRLKGEEKGVRFSIYLLESQLKVLDQRAKENGMTRSKYVEMMTNLPPRIQNKVSDNYGKGQKKGE